MAINVDPVYQRVQAILNKEQRGFLSPQKFNLYANHVQLDIFEQYFYDLAQYLRIPGNSSEYADVISIIEQKISLFETEDSSPTYSANYFKLPTDCYRLGILLYGNIECTPVTKKEYGHIERSPIGKPSDARPIYVKDINGVKVLGTNQFTDIAPSADPITMQYVKTPANVVWGYTDILGVESYNASTSVNFELDPSEETDVTLKILALAGLEVKDLSVYQTAAQEDGMENQQEKQ
jgi:hypothetical protein